MSATYNKNMTTNTKSIIDANQRHIVSCYKGLGGLTGFVDQVDYLVRGHHITPYAAIRMMVDGGDFLVYNIDVQKYLHRIGLTKKLDSSKAWDTYKSLLARDGAKLYASYKKKHPAKR